MAARRYIMRKSFKFGLRRTPRFAEEIKTEPCVLQKPFSQWSGFKQWYVDLLCSGVLVGGTVNQYRRTLPRRKYAKKGATAGYGLGEQTRDLIAALKQCLNNEPSLEQLWSTLQTSVAQMVPNHDKPSSKRKKKKVKKQHLDNSPQTQQQLHWWTDGSGRRRAYTIDETGWWTWAPAVALQTPKQTAKQTVEPERNYKLQKGSPVQDRHGAWISGVRTADWGTQVVPKLVSFPKIRESLKFGNQIDGNLVEIWQPDVLDELSTLWSCFDKQEGMMTALLFGEAKAKTTEATPARISVTRGNFGQKIEETSLLQIGSSKGPTLPSSKRVDIQTIPKVQRETLRIAAPNFFRAPFIGDRKEDSPTLIVQALAGLAEAPVQEFLGGRWTVQETKDGKQLVAFLRLKAATVAKLKPLSGRSGLFFTHINPKEKEDVQPYWIQRNSPEDDETYYRRVTALQKDRHQPMLFSFRLRGQFGFCQEVHRCTS